MTSNMQCLATYFNAIMFMVAASVVTTILILNYHHRKTDTHEMPVWVRLNHITSHTTQTIWAQFRD